MEDDIEERLASARAGIRDDIRGLFRDYPEYGAYLCLVLSDAIEEIMDLRQQVPAPAPHS